MIEQFSSGMPQVSQPAAGALRDRQASTEQDEKSGTFEDLVSKAGERETLVLNKGDDTSDMPENDVAKVVRPVDGLPKAVFELSAALKGLTNPAQQDDNSKSAALKDVIRIGDKPELSERQVEAVLEKLVEKTRQAGKVEAAEVKNQAINDPEPLTASDELSLLLGLTRDVEPKTGRKAASADAADKSDGKSDDDASTDKLDARSDAADGDPMLIAIDTRQGRNDDVASDDAAPRGDIVRVTSVNGRGKSVDIEMPSMPGAQSQETAKSSNTSKVETATVLEARRYLGFSTDTNGAALAAAVKSDPTWTEALQSAQRADIGSLANTVTEVNTLKLQLNPENLGSMVASLKLKGEELTVELRVTTVEAYQHLSADHDEIVKSLQDQGFSIDKVTVQLNATDRTDTGADRDLARQQGQAQRDGQAEREGQGGQSGRNDGSREQQRWPSGEKLVDGNPGDGGADAGRSGNLYL